LAAAASSELTCLKSIHGLPHPFSTTIKGTDGEFSLELFEVLIIASTSKPPTSAARLRMSQCCKLEELVPLKDDLVKVISTNRHFEYEVD